MGDYWLISQGIENKVTDLGKVIPVIDQNGDRVVSIQKWENYSFNQILKFENKKLVFEKYIEADSLEKAIIRPYNFTFNPEDWDRESLYVPIHNGGNNN